MAQWMSLILLVVAATIAVTESRAVPSEPMMLDTYGNPIVFLREKRTAVHPYPHRAMMFTGYYRPVRRSNHGGQATGVFAQGNAVSGEAFFSGMQAPHLKNGPEPIEESELSSAEAQAQASPEGEETYNEEEPSQVQPEEEYQPEEHHRQDGHHSHEEQPHHHHQDDHHSHEEPHHHHHHQDEEHSQEDEGYHHKHHDLPPQDQPEPVPAFTTEAALVTPAEEPVHTNTEVSANRPKVHHGKKNKKTPVIVNDDEEEDEEDDDELSVPYIPFKGSRRRQNYPNLNNFFPMVFSFPGGSTRAGSNGGSPPGAVTAIANSYSTGKGGVASSVATAYGGSPNGKKRRTPTPEE